MLSKENSIPFKVAALGDIHYLNDGDWVESCSALVENMDGRFEIIYWHKVAEGVAVEITRENAMANFQLELANT